MMARLLPHPLLTLSLTVVWVMLLNSLSLGGLLLGLILGVAVPLLTRSFWPERALVHRPLTGVVYVLIVLWDIVVANVAVARIVLFRSNSKLRSHYVTIPLDVRSPSAITILAGTITMTPGTVSADLSADGRSLLVHCLDDPDPEATRDTIKRRYESRLKEIFE